MSSSSTLQSKIALCRTLDQRRFRRKLSKCKDDEKRLASLGEEIAESMAWVAAREQLNFSVEYPDLPVSARKDEIAEILEKHQVVVIAGETGSGKTTQLPKICWELGRGKFGLIGHTQPRRLAARAVASRIAEELKTTVGDLVGYQVRFGDQTSTSSRIKLMTDGILLAEIQQDPFLNRYDTLIIDEAHERSLNIDFLLGYLKRLLPKRRDLKLIITSATIDLARFSEHFNNAPIIEVSGRTYPVELLYRPLLSDSDSDAGDLSIQEAIAAAVDEIEGIERQQGRMSGGDVLVFLSGERDIRETADYLRKQEYRDTEILPLYARLSNAEQNRIFHPTGRGRRIVLSTNVAETSLTVPGIRYVIDPGNARISRYSYRSKVQRLPIEPISQASANQRKGRCGRVAAGVCIRLYSEDDFNLRSEFTDAEILRTNLAAVILRMQGLKLGSVDAFPFIDPPDPRVVRDGVRLLQELKALDDHGEITPLGRQLSALPVDPKLGRMLVEAAKTRCLSEVLIIVSALGVQDPRERPHDKKQKADEVHRAHQDKDSDFITYVNLWNTYEAQRQDLSNSQLRQYCKKQFLAFMRMREWRDLHRQLHLSCRDLGFKENTSPAGYGSIHKALLSGLLGNVGFRMEEGEYLGARNRKFRIFPGSGLFKARPKWMVAAEVVETSQLFARTVAKIEPEWIESLAQHLVKRSYVEPHWEQKPAEVIAYEQQTLYGLQIVNRRKVHYGRIDPVESQSIFVRSALVEGQFQTKGAFFEHNQKLLTEVEALEDKSRRRDILVDEDQLHSFYQQRLIDHGGDKVVNGVSFERWRKSVEEQQPDILKLSQDQLMNHAAEDISEERFPAFFVQGNLKLPLSYQFEPGAENDGVTLKVPVGAMSQLSEQQLEWLVPGMLREKCIAMLKALPKQIRKNFVPIPDYVDAFMQNEVPRGSSLTEALSESLRKMTGVRIDRDVWESINLEDHYQMNVHVVDERGATIAQDRNLAGLMAHAAEYPQETNAKCVEAEDIGNDWSIDKVPQVAHREQAGIRVEVFPALTCVNNVISVIEHNDPHYAKHQHRQAVTALILRKYSKQLTYFRHSFKGRWNQVALKFSTVAPAAELWIDFTFAVVDSLVENSEECRDTDSFKTLSEFVLVALEARINEMLTLIEEIATLYLAVRKKLSGSVQLAWATVLTDMKGQTERLCARSFMRQTPYNALTRYPVFLRALMERHEKFQQDLNKQRLLSEQLMQAYARFDTKIDSVTAGSSLYRDLNTYRWMLEEYRISLFAQQLKTIVSVSEKKLDRFWRDRCQ